MESSSRDREKNSHEIHWHDLDQVKFLGLLSTCALISRTSFHPLAVIKTRLQTQGKGGKTTYTMAKDILLREGLRRGLYRGYSVSLSALLFEPVFMGTLETTRTFLSQRHPSFLSTSQWDTFTSSAAGGFAALLQQTFLVPIDVLTQRVMITRSRDGIRIPHVIEDILKSSGDGIRGFYKGYLITLASALPFNSIIWTLFWKIQYQMEKIISSDYARIIPPLSATIAALTTSLITQPIDVLKTRLQVASQRQSLRITCALLIRERGFRGLFAGSTARAAIIVPNCVVMMSLYEIIKRASVKTLYA